MARLSLKLRAILNKSNGQVIVYPPRKYLKKMDEHFEEKIRKRKRMLIDFGGFE